MWLFTPTALPVFSIYHLIKDGIDLSILDVLPTMGELRENHFLLLCVASSLTVR